MTVAVCVSPCRDSKADDTSTKVNPELARAIIKSHGTFAKLDGTLTGAILTHVGTRSASPLQVRVRDRSLRHRRCASSAHDAALARV